jgi:hypothetical protein
MNVIQTEHLKTPSRVVFLDVDGVLNYTLWYLDDRNPGNLNGEEGDIDPLCVERINILCEKLSAKIVVSSDWRVCTNWQSRLEKAGLKNIIDKTPITLFGNYGRTYHFTRGEEIDMWLQWHPGVKNYVIIDDREDMMKDQMDHFVKVNSYRGFSDEDLEKAMFILNQ